MPEAPVLQDVTNAVTKAAERRCLRGKLRHLLTRTHGCEEQLTRDALSALLDQADELQQRVEKPREHAVESEVFRNLAIFGRDTAKRAACEQQGKTPADFIVALQSQYFLGNLPASDPSAFQWHALGRDVGVHAAAVTVAGCMLGALQAQAPQNRRPAAPRRPAVKRPQPETFVAPQEMANIEETDKQETDRNMEEMWERLKGGPPMPFVRVVCNPRSFSQTVENIFTLSFLVRDQWVLLHSDDQEGLVVTPRQVEQAAPAQAAASAASSRQFCISFDVAKWEVLRMAVAPDECLMRDRGTGHEAAAKPSTQMQRADANPGQAKRRRCG